MSIQLNSYIDHTLLSPTSSLSNISLHCEQAVMYNFYSVCINSNLVPYVEAILGRTRIKVCSTINFPLGASSLTAVCREAEQAIEDGADELDTVINISLLKSGYLSKVCAELKELRKVTNGKILKVIIENCLLTTREKIEACKICCDAEADFVKTSTGFSTGGATIEDIVLMKETTLDSPIKIKAAGGIRDYETTQRFIDAGSSRIGTSNGVAIITGSPESELLVDKTTTNY